MTSVGALVARSRDSSVHIARIVKSDGVVVALCGNTLLRPRQWAATARSCATRRRSAMAARARRSTPTRPFCADIEKGKT